MIQQSTIRPSKIEVVQYVRAMAAVLVVAHHSYLEFQNYDGLDKDWIASRLFFGCSVGVDFFFVISGFIIAKSVSNGKDSFITFTKKRLVRILPNYWLYSTLTLIIVFFSKTLKRNSVITVKYIITSYLLVAYPRPSDGEFLPLLGLGWTLNYEVFFYLIVAIMLAFSIDRKKISLFVICFLIILSLINIWIPESEKILGFYTNPIIIEFMIGVVIYEIFQSGFSFKVNLMPFILIVFTFLWCYNSIYLGWFSGFKRLFIWGIPAGFLVYGLLNTHLSEKYVSLHNFRRVLLKIGNASYSLYLSHIFIIRAFTIVIKLMKIHVNLVQIFAFVAVETLLCIVVSFGLYNHIERRIARLFEL